MIVISQPNYEVLDEVFFTNFMRWFMVGIDHTPYQLPGLSFIVAPFVYLFGDNWFSWRFPIIIFGMVFLYFYYKVCEHVTNKKIALLSTVILSLSPMIFIHSSLMLRDIPVMALGFAGLYLYFKQKYYFASLIIGLSALIKETAFFFVVFIVLHYTITNREKIIMQASSSMYKLCCGFIKTPLFTILILSASFLIPLTIYENTITVLEYSTADPEYIMEYSNGELHTVRFNVLTTSTEILKKPVDFFNYTDQVKNPIHHLNLLFTKGYYTYDIGANGFLASFLPIQPRDSIPFNNVGLAETRLSDKNIEYHLRIFTVGWDMGTVNYSYWFVAFWSCVGLVAYALYQRFRNHIPLPNNIMFVLCGFSFFIPFLFITLIRDSFAYYMIYFLPFMALGLVLGINKITNKKIRLLVMVLFLTGIMINFIIQFPLLTKYL